MSENIGSGTILGLIEYLDNLVSKGWSSPGSIIPLKSAVRRVLSVVEGEEKWLKMEASAIDIDNYILRFGNMTNGRYKAESLSAYKSRLERALTWYKQALLQPGWTPPKSAGKSLKNEVKKVEAKTPPISEVSAVVQPPTLVSPISQPLEQSDLIAYPFPLRKDRIVRLYLPSDLSTTEAKRLGRYIESLSMGE